MAKQNRKRPGQNKRRAAAAPYADQPKGKGGKGKPTVNVTYEGQQPSKPVAGGKAAPPPPPPKKQPPKAEKEVVKRAPMESIAAAVEEEKAKGKERESETTFKIIAGSYEKLLYGLEGHYPAGSDKPVLEPIFIFPAHLACVKAIAASPSGKWLATGSEDEFVKVWDLRRRKEVGNLTQHTGSITSLTFPTPSHLLTTSVDSTLSLFRTSDWALLKSLKGHSGRVNHVDVHPTGRVALSVGKDNTLKMWDLMRGRGAASLQLGSEAELVKFSPSGTHFAVLFPRKVEIYSLTLKLLRTLETKARYNSLLFAELPGEDGAEFLCIGTEKGVVEVYTVELGGASDEDDEDEDEDMEKDKAPKAEFDLVAKLVGHTNRVKAISSLQVLTPSGPSVLLTSVSSDGKINLYDLGLIPTSSSEEQEPVASYDTKGSRLTCVFLAEGGAPRRQKTVVKAADDVESFGRKARFAEEGGEEEDEDDEEEDDEEDDEDGDMYEGSEDDELGGMEVEFEDEEEDEEEGEEEDEGEYED